MNQISAASQANKLFRVMGSWSVGGSNGSEKLYLRQELSNWYSASTRGHSRVVLINFWWLSNGKIKLINSAFHLIKAPQMFICKSNLWFEPMNFFFCRRENCKILLVERLIGPQKWGKHSPGTRINTFWGNLRKPNLTNWIILRVIRTENPFIVFRFNRKWVRVNWICCRHHYCGNFISW